MHLVKSSGIEPSTPEELAPIDKSRERKGYNDNGEPPPDPDAKITPMKDGRSHWAYKAEHAVDRKTGAMVAVTLQPANRGDTTSLTETIERTDDNLVGIMADETVCT